MKFSFKLSSELKEDSHKNHFLFNKRHFFKPRIIQRIQKISKKLASNPVLLSKHTKNLYKLLDFSIQKKEIKIERKIIFLYLFLPQKEL